MTEAWISSTVSGKRCHQWLEQVQWEVDF